MAKKYEIRIRENNSISRQYASGVHQLAILLGEIEIKNVVGIYKLTVANDIIVSSEKLDWGFQRNNLSLKTITTKKTLPSDVIPLNQTQIDELTKKVLGDKNQTGVGLGSSSDTPYGLPGLSRASKIGRAEGRPSKIGRAGNRPSKTKLQGQVRKNKHG